MSKWAGWLLLGFLFACAGPEEMPMVQPMEAEEVMEEEGEVQKPGQIDLKKKNKIVQNMESQMRILLGQAVRRFEEIRKRFDDELATLTVPYKIRAVPRELSDFYLEEEEAYEARVDGITESFMNEINATLEYLEPRVWEIAFSIVGSEDLGASFGSRTGMDEVDEIANVTLELIDFRSGRYILQDMGKHAREKRILLNRVYKNDVEGQGRLSIYLSDALRHHFRKDEQAIAVAVVFQREGLDPSISVGFRQIVRNRIVRGGITRLGSKFHWDRTFETADGFLPLAKEGRNPEVTVAKVFFPRVDMDSPQFTELYDFTAIRDYETALVNLETGEVLDCAAWQLKWQISHHGAVSIEKGANPAKVEDLKEFETLSLTEERGG